MSKKGLKERLDNGGTLVVAEGYIFEFERKGYLKAGAYVPEVVIEHPDLVRQMYEEFVHAGSDVVLAFTYYAHREKLRHIGREADLERMNTIALRMAREVADEHGCLMAGNICNSAAYLPEDDEALKETEQMFKEQIEMAVNYGADYIVAETFHHFGEAMLALTCVKKYGNGLPACVTLSSPKADTMSDGVKTVEACKLLEDAGAAVVGLNCGRGPETMLPQLREIRKICKGPIAALPVPYRTTLERPTFFNLNVPGTESISLNLLTCLCSRDQIADFSAQCKEIGVQYIGLCCGNSANLLRIVAEVYGKNPPASKYSPAMEQHYIFGDIGKHKEFYIEDLQSTLLGKQ